MVYLKILEKLHWIIYKAKEHNKKKSERKNNQNKSKPK